MKVLAPQLRLVEGKKKVLKINHVFLVKASLDNFKKKGANHAIVDLF